MADPNIVPKPESSPKIIQPSRDAGLTSVDVMEEKSEDNEKSAIGVNIYEDNENRDNKNDEKEEEEDEEDKKESKKPLLDEDSVTIEIKTDKEGEDTPTLPLPDKKKKSTDDSEAVEKKQKAKLPIYLFPITRIKDAWNDSTNTFQFIARAVCIIFQTVGWFTCVGGVPFLSLVMLIIGSIYVNDCRIQPNIPIYLIVSGVIGTIQHFLTIWTKYVPKESTGRLITIRRHCQALNGLFHLFLIIWFILGCVWVYGAHPEVNFRYPERDEYCHKTLYYFAFWIMNLSFILFGILMVLSLCFLICIIATPRDEEKKIIQ